MAITPEEVIDYAGVPHFSGQHARAALFDLGRSEWLASFAPRHLERCRHYQLFFYDELVEGPVNTYDACSTNCCGDDCPCPPGSGCC